MPASPAKPAQAPSWLAAAADSADDEAEEEPAAAPAPAPVVVPAFDAFDGLAPHTPAEAAATKPQPAAEQEQAPLAAADPFNV